MSDDPMPASRPPEPSRQPEGTHPPVGAIVTALWVFALVLTAGTGGYLLSKQAKRFSVTVAQSEADKSSLGGQVRSLKDQLQSLQQDLGTLAEAHAALTADRDHLQAQSKRLMQEKDDFSVVTDLHERVLKRTAEENRSLKAQLEPLEQEHDTMLQQQQVLAGERDSLKRQLELAQTNSPQHRLEEQLAKEKAQHKKDVAVLYDTRKQLKEIQARHAKLNADLPKLQAKLNSLQEKYSKTLSENKALSFRTKTVPAEVTTLAREHQRLVKDLADTHYNLGLMFVKQDDFARAVKEFVKVMELKPDDADAAYNLGLIYAEHLPDREKATEYFRRYLRINPRAKDAAFVKQYIASWKAWEAEDSLE